jgi:subfamily B ATP-binding cassette protein HlyB/CyaB
VEPLYLADLLIENPRLRKLTGVELTKFWNGETILLAPRKSPILDKVRQFNIGWFIPSIVKYRGLFAKVLFATFLIQIFGLITPLFFQVVMDKVLLHKAMTTLKVITIGFVAASMFEVALNALRNYIFNHTTTRIDVELGARLLAHLIKLPLSWFQNRQAGQSTVTGTANESFRPGKS